MKHAFIAPTKYLHLIPEDSTFHLLLAHLLSDPEYAAFYKKRKEAGDFIIIDNGAFEFKKPLEPAAYRELVLKSGVVPDVVVAPDYPFQPWQKTVAETITFCETIYDHFPPDTEIMAVPQSETGDYKGWLEGYKALSSSPAITWIGMSILGIPNAFQGLTGTKDISYNRLFATTYLLDKELISYRVEHHYLGLGDNVRELQLQAQLGVAYSNDSSSAFWRGIVGGIVDGNSAYDSSALGQANGKIQMEVDFNVNYDPRDQPAIEANIKFIQDLLRY